MEIAIGEVKRPDIQDDVIAKIFWQLTLDSPACVA